MARLINADKVRKKLVYFTCSTGIDEAPYEFASDIIDKEPTVDAIPIEWLMKKADEYASMEITKDGKPYMFTIQEVAGMIILLVKEWEKENGK